jgi:hypothetical protein
VLKRAIIAPSSGIGKQSFYLNEQTIFFSLDQLEKKAGDGGLTLSTMHRVSADFR